MRRDPAETRERILEAATRAFAEAGYAGASVRTIARSAGVNIATLAYHFEDKKGLYGEVVARYYRRILETSRPPPAEGDWVAALIGALWRSIRGQRDGLRVLMRHTLDAGALDMEDSRAALAPFAEEVAARTGMPRTRADLLVTSFGYLISRYAANSDEELCRLAGVDDVERAERIVLEHLVDLARRAVA